MEHLSSVRNLFRAHGLRYTRQRDAVYSALASMHEHPTAEELFEHPAVRLQSPSLSTVYNALEALSERGLCRRIASARAGGSSRYDADLSDHVHLQRADGTVIDVPDELARGIIDRLDRCLLEDIEHRMSVRVGHVVVQFVERQHPLQDPKPR